MRRGTSASARCDYLPPWRRTTRPARKTQHLSPISRPKPSMMVLRRKAFQNPFCRRRGGTVAQRLERKTIQERRSPHRRQISREGAKLAKCKAGQTPRIHAAARKGAASESAADDVRNMSRKQARIRLTFARTIRVAIERRGGIAVAATANRWLTWMQTRLRNKPRARAIARVGASAPTFR